jgi:hypothetical protein
VLPFSGDAVNEENFNAIVRNAKERAGERIEK